VFYIKSLKFKGNSFGVGIERGKLFGFLGRRYVKSKENRSLGIKDWEISTLHDKVSL